MAALHFCKCHTGINEWGLFITQGEIAVGFHYEQMLCALNSSLPSIKYF